MEVRNLGVESQSIDRSQQIQKIDADGTDMVRGQVGIVADGGVKMEVGNAGGGPEVAKRKRGRPPKFQTKAPLAKKAKEEDDEEDVCFICFDGGTLVLCDRRGCPKAYHLTCIKRDEAFLSKAKWNCGWHICSMCEKTAYHMCYTCTYSLCKGCIKKADYVCVRGDKGFCTVCMKTIMLFENSRQGKEETAKVDFDDKTSWEYLFKVYWVYLKEKLSLTFDELTRATNPWKSSSSIAVVGPPASHVSATGRRSITADTSFGNRETSEAKRANELTNGLPAESPSTVGSKEWASKELMEFVAHMKNGDTSVLTQFGVQALLLEYIKRNNLRDPRKNTQIICDSRLYKLFGKPRVGHIEMLKLLELHFSVKEDSQKNTINITEKKGDTDNTQAVGIKERRNHRKGTRRTTQRQNKLDEYAAIDVHNMNLIYLRHSLMESLIEDGDKFHDKVVGSFVKIRISGSDQKDDMYRLVQVVGTTKVDTPYKIGDKLVNIMLEVLNLDKKEAVSIDTVSNQELSEDECRRLRESIRCGLVRCFTVGEIQEKAMALQPVLLDDRMEIEMRRLTNLRDQALENGQKKGVRECMQKLQRLKTPEERERRLRDVPEVHSDPKMNPDYESDDTEEYFNNEHGEHPKPKFSWVSGTNTIPPSNNTIPPQKNATTSPKSEITPPKNAATPPESAITLPNNAANPPKNAATPPESAITLPKNVATSPKNAATPPESAITLPKNAATSPKNAATPPESVITLPESVITSPKSAATFPESAITLPINVATSPENAATSPENAATPAKSATISQKTAESLYDQPKDSGGATCPTVDEDVCKAVGGSNTEKDEIGLGSPERLQDEVDCNGSMVGNPVAAVSLSLSNMVSEPTPQSPSIPDNPSVNVNVNDDVWHHRDLATQSPSIPDNPSVNVNVNVNDDMWHHRDLASHSPPMPDNPSVSVSFNVDDDVWHYRDPSGNIQGPFSMLQLHRWRTNGYFPPDMRVWANQEANSLFLTDALQEQFDNHEGRNAVHNNKVSNQIEGVNVSIAVPSSTVFVTPNPLNQVNLEKSPDTLDSLNQVNLEKLPDNRDSSDARIAVPSSTVFATPDALNQVNHEKLPDTRDSLNQVNLEKLPDNHVFSDASIAIPSSTVFVTPYAVNQVNLNKLLDTRDSLNQVNLEKLPDKRDSSGESSGQNLNINDYNLNSNPPSVAFLTKMNESMEQQFDIENIRSSSLKGHDADTNTHVSPPFTIVDLPSPLVKKAINEDKKEHDTRDIKKETYVPPSKLLVQDLGNSNTPPSWSTALSLVIGGAQLPETTEEWGRYRYPSTTVKPEEWDSGRVSVSSPKSLEVAESDEVGNRISFMDQLMHPSPPPSPQPYNNNLPSWHGLGETIEFSTLAEESVSDLLAEVDAMESRNGVPSPTSRRSSFLDDLFNGSIDDFSPTGDQATRSYGFHSSADLNLHRHPATTVDHLAGASHGNNTNGFDFIKQSTGLQPFSFGLETKSACVVSMPQTSHSGNIGFKWPELGGSDFHPPRQDMIDLNDSTRAEADEGERETRTNDDLAVGRDMAARQAEARGGRKSKGVISGGHEKPFDRIKPEVAGTKLFGGFPEVEAEEGEFILPLTGPLLPLPLTPPLLTMGLDVADSRRPGRPSPGSTTGSRLHADTNASRSGNVGRESSHHRRSGVVDRYSNSSNSPRERGHHVEDSGGHSRSNRGSWSRQSSFSSSGGHSRPPSKSQRICKFYESGRCKKGSACTYLHQ